jgi:ribA/ribD-fused uncharacterized protein
MKMIDAFDGEYRFLSNFWPDDGFTNEHVFQAMKTQDWAEQMIVLTAADPYLAKKYGRKVTLRPDWNEIKDDVMLVSLRLKFSQNPELRAKLLATGDAELIEGNTWGDRYWGVCDGNGHNKLGILLMQVRGELSDAETS